LDSSKSERSCKRGVGILPGLTIHTDACKGLAYAVKKVFQGDVEHRECFRHLMANFRKQFKGDVLKYMWPCAWACTDCRYDALMEKIAAASPKAVTFLNRHHKLKWYRSKFSKECKVDYVNNNISECFNNWIKDYKDLPVADLMDKIREKIMEKIYTRQEIADRMEGRILASVLHELNMKSRGLHYEILRTSAMSADISGITKEGKNWRVPVDIEKKTCGCGQWQISGKPCTHAIALFGKIRNINIENFIDDYYSVERFKTAYQFVVTPMGDKTDWPKFDPGFKMVPPKLERPAGRPRKKRIKASGEAGKRGPYQCKRCFQFGHIEKGCIATQAELEQELPPPRPKKSKGQRKSKSEVVEVSMIDAEPSPNVADPKVACSPGVTTRSMSSLSPTSPGPTTRRMASISPGGINRRLIIS